MAVRTYAPDDEVEVLDLDLQEWVPGVVSSLGDVGDVTPLVTIKTERMHSMPDGETLPLMYGILIADLDRCVRPRGPEHLRGGESEAVCVECGRDNRWATHDALQMTGHLSHAFMAEPEQPATLAGQPNPFAKPDAAGSDPFANTHLEGN